MLDALSIARNEDRDGEGEGLRVDNGNNNNNNDAIAAAPPVGGLGVLRAAGVGAALRDRGEEDVEPDPRRRTANVLHLFGWFNIIFLLCEYVFNQVLTWTQYFRNDYYFFGFSLFFSIVPLLVVSGWTAFTASRNYRRLRRHFSCACLLYVPVLNVLVFLSPMMYEHMDIAKLQAAFTFVHLLYIVYPLFIINVMYLCLYGNIQAYSENNMNHNFGKVINNYASNDTSQVVINGHLAFCLIILTLVPIAMFTYCSVIRARFGFYYADFATKCKDYVFKFGLITTILLPALTLEVIHFWPLFLEYYYYHQRNDDTGKNTLSFDSLMFCILLLVFNLPKALFVPEIFKFSKADFGGLMKLFAFGYSAVTYIPLPLVPFLIRLRRYVTHSESQSSVKGRYSLVASYCILSYGSMLIYFLFVLTWQHLGLLTQICVALIIASLIALLIGIIFCMPAFARVTLTWRRSQSNNNNNNGNNNQQQ